MTEPLRLNIVVSPHQNAFFHELATAMHDGVQALGYDVRIIEEPGKIRPTVRDVFVLLPPHEWTAIEGDAWLANDRLAARTVGIGAEQPHSAFFARNAEIGSRLGLFCDFSAHAVSGFRDLGVSAVHVPFGYVPAWDRFGGQQAAHRDLDVVFMGNFKQRRLHTLASMAESLGCHRSRLILSNSSAPNTATSRWFVAGDAKRSLLASTKVILNIHQAEERYFEWLRFSEAAMCGCVFLTETSEQTDIYRPDVDFVAAEREHLVAVLDALLDDPDRLEALRHEAYERVRSRPFTVGLAVLVEHAEELLVRPVPARLPDRRRAVALPHARSAAPTLDPASPLVRRSRRIGWRRRTERTAAAPVSPERPGAPIPVSEILVAEVVAVGPLTVGQGDDSVRGITIRRIVADSLDEARVAISRSTADAVTVVSGDRRWTARGLAALLEELTTCDAATGMSSIVDADGGRTLRGLWPRSAEPDNREPTGAWFARRGAVDIGSDLLGNPRFLTTRRIGHVPSPVQY